MHLLICSIGDRKYAFDLTVVDRSILAVECTPLPNAPPYLLGAINMHGQIIPAINLRQLLNLPAKDIDIEDHFIICRSHQRTVALWVDSVDQVLACTDEDLSSAAEILSDSLDAVQYVLKKDDQMALVLDLDKLVPSHHVPSGV